ncbi:hypothetical protein GCM10010400_15550 [Streptomyces aculeolatus]
MSISTPANTAPPVAHGLPPLLDGCWGLDGAVPREEAVGVVIGTHSLPRATVGGQESQHRAGRVGGRAV